MWLEDGSTLEFTSPNCNISAWHRWAEDTLAERLRRRPAKPMGSPRVGSNPTGVVSILCNDNDFRSFIIIINVLCFSFPLLALQGAKSCRDDRAAPGIEPGTSRTRSENHATRPSSQLTMHEVHQVVESSGSPMLLASSGDSRFGRGHVGWAGGFVLSTAAGGPPRPSPPPSLPHVAK